MKAYNRTFSFPPGPAKARRKLNPYRATDGCELEYGDELDECEHGCVSVLTLIKAAAREKREREARIEALLILLSPGPKGNPHSKGEYAWHEWEAARKAA